MVVAEANMVVVGTLVGAFAFGWIVVEEKPSDRALALLQEDPQDKALHNNNTTNISPV